MDVVCRHLGVARVTEGPVKLLTWSLLGMLLASSLLMISFITGIVVDLCLYFTRQEDRPVLVVTRGVPTNAIKANHVRLQHGARASVAWR